MFTCIKKCLVGAGIGLSQHRPSPTMDSIMTLSRVTQKLGFLHSTLLFVSFSENTCSGNHLYHEAENSIRDKGITWKEISPELLQAPEVKFSFFYKIVSFINSKGAALHCGWTGRRPGKSKPLGYWNFQSSSGDSNVEFRLKTSNSDQWPSRWGLSSLGWADIWDQISLGCGTMLSASLASSFWNANSSRLSAVTMKTVSRNCQMSLRQPNGREPRTEPCYLKCGSTHQPWHPSPESMLKTQNFTNSPGNSHAH